MVVGMVRVYQSKVQSASRDHGAGAGEADAGVPQSGGWRTLHSACIALSVPGLRPFRARRIVSLLGLVCIRSLPAPSPSRSVRAVPAACGDSTVLFWGPFLSPCPSPVSPQCKSCTGCVSRRGRGACSACARTGAARHRRAGGGGGLGAGAVRAAHAGALTPSPRCPCASRGEAHPGPRPLHPRPPSTSTPRPTVAAFSVPPPPPCCLILSAHPTVKDLDPSRGFPCACTAAGGGVGCDGAGAGAGGGGGGGGAGDGEGGVPVAPPERERQRRGPAGARGGRPPLHVPPVLRPPSEKASWTSAGASRRSR